MKKLNLSFIALLCSSAVIAEELGQIPTVTDPNAVEMRANPNTGSGMRSVQATMPPVAPRVKDPRLIDPLGATNYKAQPTQSTATTIVQEMTPQQRAKVKEKAFERQMEYSFPMTDDQIRRVNGKMENLEKAYRQSTNPVPDYVPAEATMSFGINADMPVVMLGAKGIYETSILFTDSTGAPWEISSFNVANSTEFMAYRSENINGNQLSLLTTAPFGVTSLTVNLKGSPSPLVFQLVTGQPEAYSIFNAKVAAVGPNAPKGSRFSNLGGISGQGFNSNDDLEELLTGVVPKGLKSLTLTGQNVGNDTFAWASRDGQYIYIRTPKTINAPMPIDGGRIGGTNDMIYQLKRTQLISFAHHGRDITVKVSGMPIYSPNK